MNSAFKRIAPVLLLLAGVVTVFWKIVITDQYTFLESPDLANQVMPWLQAQVYALRHWSVLLWDPYEWFGQSLIGQVQPGVTSPFTFLLALAPLHNGFIQPFWVDLWYVFIHCAAAIFAWWLFVDLGCGAGAAAIGALFYATAGFCGNTEWPQQLQPGIWAPLVFLFLLRSLRGRTPRKSAAWAGVMLGLSWLSGHHEPALMLTLAALGTAAAALFRPRHRQRDALSLAIMTVVMALVSAVQILPAVEYGKLAKRWTASGALTWKDRVGIPEHEDSGLPPNELYHLIVPGAGLRADPFAGIVGLGLAAIAIWGAFGRREVRLFAVLGVCALLYAMARNDAFYGWFYALVPGVEKSRAPIVSLSILHFSLAALAAFGAGVLSKNPQAARASKLLKTLLWFGGAVFALLIARSAVASALTGDPRAVMIAVIALLFAALLYAWMRGYVRREWALVLVGALVAIEQGNEVGWNWPAKSDQKRAVFLKPLYDNEDAGHYLQWLPSPKRIGVNDDDLKFTVGDWFRIDAAHAFTASMLVATSELGWWSDRLVQMYGVNYEVSRAPMRAGVVPLFTGKTGIRIWGNPNVFARAWTVHQIAGAPDEGKGAEMVRDSQIDLATTAVMAGPEPALDRCAGADRVISIQEKPSLAAVDVDMACKGMVVVSDNFYPGWIAQVDGHAARIWKVNTVIRGVVVEGGRHRLVMKYRPFSVYFGLFCTLLGLGAAIFLQRRGEPDAAGPSAGALAHAQISE